jgi:alpha-beta hydrolase superfamily lysophospholipase
LIQDAIATVNWALNVAEIPPSRVVILGHSLGTAVTIAVCEHFAISSGVDFAGIILVAPFTDIPKLMLTYSAGGVIPALSPLRPYPRLQRWCAGHIADTWRTIDRLRGLVQASQRLKLVLIHSKNDPDIPWQHSEALFYAAANATASEPLSKDRIDAARESLDRGAGGWMHRWDDGAGKVIQLELLRYGGKCHANGILETMRG